MNNSSQRPRRKSTKNTFTTHSGKTIQVNRSLTERMKAGREAKAQRKAAYLSTLPKEPWKRLLYRLEPKRLYRYWFSRDGAIMALKVAGIGFVVIFLMIVSLFAYFRKDLPKIKDLNSANSGGSIAYYDRTGKTLLFQDYGAYKRIPVDQANISKYMQQATIAIEDKEFYHEGAFNVKGITRAAINNAKGGSTQGGSTITQQVVKLNANWTNDRTVSRKVKELILAVELEREYSKDEILTGYLNLAPYSGQDYGVQAASQDYFGVDASQLTLAQASMMAAIPKAPGTLSPYASPLFNTGITADFFNKAGLLSRQAYILNQMAKQGYITQTQADEAKKVDVIAQVHPKPVDKYAGIKAPYFYQSAYDELVRSFPEGAVAAGGWKVITTLDMNLQTLAEKSINDNRYLLRRYQADSAAFVAEDNETGQVTALIGGLDYTNPDYGQNNYASRINISPGSSVKPYDYTTFINNNTNVGAGSVLYDAVGPLPQYPCTNKATPEQSDNANCLWDYDRRSPGPVTLRYALGGSRNIPAAKAFLSALPGDTSSNKTNSINKVLSTVTGLMGVDDGYHCYDTSLPKVQNDFFHVGKNEEGQCYTSAAIGDGAYLHLNDHVNGIASLARMGKSIPQTFILKVTNNSGKVLKQFSQPKGTQVVKADSAYIVSNMASDPKASYLSGNCSDTTCSGMKFHRYKGWTNAIKTGTTNKSFDGLMMSWNPKYTAGIWIGNHTRTQAFNTAPENITDPIMKAFMQGAIDNLGGVKAQTFEAPSDIKTASAYVVTNRYLGQVTPSSSTDIYPSWYVGSTKSSSSSTDKVSGKLATSCTPSLARQTSYNSNTSIWNVDIFMGGNPSTTASASTTPQGSDDVHSCSDNAPSATITAVNGSSTNGNATPNCPVSGCTILVHIEQGTHPFSDPAYPDYPGTINLLVNNQVVQSQDISSSGDYQLTYKPDATDGSVQLQAQVVDSVLYQGTDTKTINIKSTSAFKQQTTSGGGNGKKQLASWLADQNKN